MTSTSPGYPWSPLGLLSLYVTVVSVLDWTVQLAYKM